MSNAKTYVEFKGRMMASRCSTIIRTPHIKEVPIQLEMVSSPFLAERGLL
jgi:hypothetical protein